MSQQSEDRLGRYAEMKNEIAAIRSTVNSSDRSVTVVAGPGGSVLDLKLSDHAFSAGSPSSLASTVMSTLRLAVAAAAKEQASIVQRYVGDRLNIAERVMATQKEIFGDRIEAGEEEQRKLAEQQQAQAAGSVFAQQPPAARAYPPAPPQQQPPAQFQPPAPPQPQQQPQPTRRPVRQQDNNDDEGFQGLGGREGW